VAAVAAPSAGTVAAPAVAVPAVAATVAVAAAAAPSPAEAASAAPVLIAAATRASAPAAKSAASAAAKPVRKRNAAATNAPAASAANGVVRLAVSPWGQVEIDGTPAGLTPPLSQLSLPEGRHQVVIRNADFTAYSTTVNVAADQPVVVRHRFGQ
jgi:serine/threonine-protein kinase